MQRKHVIIGNEIRFDTSSVDFPFHIRTVDTQTQERDPGKFSYQRKCVTIVTMPTYWNVLTFCM